MSFGDDLNTCSRSGLNN